MDQEARPGLVPPRSDPPAGRDRAEGEEMTGHRTSRPWTEADEERLRSMILAGASPRTIVEVLDRTIDSVRVRANRLRIPLKKVTVKR